MQMIPFLLFLLYNPQSLYLSRSHIIFLDNTLYTHAFFRFAKYASRCLSFLSSLTYLGVFFVSIIFWCSSSGKRLQSHCNGNPKDCRMFTWRGAYKHKTLFPVSGFPHPRLLDGLFVSLRGYLDALVMTSEPLPVQSDSWVTPPIVTQRGHAFSHSLTSSHLSIKRNSVMDPASMANSGHSVDGVVLDITRRDSKREETGEELRFQRETSFDGPLPSPPLTRTNTKESVTQQSKEKILAGENQDSEGSVWHPLQFGDPADHTQDTTVVDLGDSIVDANGRLVFPDGMNKNSPPPSPRGSVHPIDTQKPRSPQPWELVDPPPSNGHKPSQYGTVSNKFSTLQGTSHRRPLIPKSSYYFGPPPPDAAFGTPPMGQIGVHHPREVIRIERDYTGGELIQFAPIYPLELEGRITPTQFLESINAINELLISAHSIRHSMVDNVLAVVTLYLSRLIITSHYEKEMKRLKLLFDELNSGLYNPAGLNLLWPGKVAFLYMEIEYY